MIRAADDGDRVLPDILHAGDGSESPPMRRVVVCTRWGIGDCVMSIPSLRALRRSQPDARFTWLVGTQSIDLAHAYAWPEDAVEPYQQHALRAWQDDRPEALAGAEAWVRALDAEGAPRDAVHVFGILHAPKALRDRVLDQGFVCHHGDQVAEVAVARSGAGPETAVAQNTALGWNIRHCDDDFAPLVVPDDAAAEAAALLRDAGVEVGVTAPPLAVAANAGSPLKVPDPQVVADAIEALLAQGGARPVLLFTGPEPRPAAALAEALHARGVAHTLLPPIDLNAAAGVLQRCALLLCPDSGLMHLAAAVRCPTTGLFGPTSPRFYLPRINRSAAAAPPLEEEPCPERDPDRMGPPNCNIERRCFKGHRSCIDLLRADDIVAAALPLLRPEPIYA